MRYCTDLDYFFLYSLSSDRKKQAFGYILQQCQGKHYLCINIHSTHVPVIYHFEIKLTTTGSIQ